jgi:hypothetical protein
MKRKQEIYVAPTIKVVEIKVRHTLLAGSEQLESFENGDRIDAWSNDFE